MLFQLKGQMIRGTGKSKKQAKHAAASAALRTFIQAPDAADSLGIKETTAQDFTTDVSDTSFVSVSVVQSMLIKRIYLHFHLLDF